MTELTFIRHGQAQVGAQDEKSYDSLSPLGHQQAGWLGAHFKQSRGFDHVVSGAMTRQIETAQSLSLADVPHAIDPRLNEMDFFGQAASLERRHGVGFPSEAEFEAYLPRLLAAWKAGDIEPSLESYDAFCERILDAVEAASKFEGRVLLVTSTGVIATLASIALQMEIESKSRLFLAISHTSVHRFKKHEAGLDLLQFAGVPHLDYDDRTHAVTFA